MSVFRNRLLKTATESGVLPKGYYLCEYIQSDGTQYIDTGFIPNQDTRVVADAELLIDGNNYFLFGARTGQQSNTFGFNAYQTKYRSHYYDGWTDYDTTISYTSRFTIDKNKNVTTIGGDNVITHTYTKFTCPCTMTIFAVNTYGSIGTYASAKLYSFKIYDNETLVRDFIPCVNPEGYYGLYDTVTKAFYANQGTYELRGKIILPEGYEWLDGLYASGTQYIDTGFKPSYDSRVMVEVSSITAIGFVYGTRDTASSTAANQFNIYRTGTTAIRSDYNGSNVSMTVDNTTDRMLIDQNGNVTVIPGQDVSATHPSVASGQCSYNLYLFALNNVGEPLLYATCVMHSCRIYDSGKLVRLYVPCVNKEGVWGLYDMVYGMFYTSMGEDFPDKKWIVIGRYGSISSGNYYKQYQSVPTDRKVYAISTPSTSSLTTDKQYYSNIGFSYDPCDVTDYTTVSVNGEFVARRYNADNNILISVKTSSSFRYIRFLDESTGTYSDYELYSNYASSETISVDGAQITSYSYYFDEPMYLTVLQEGVTASSFYILIDVLPEPEELKLY